MKLNWDGYGRIVHGNYVMEWQPLKTWDSEQRPVLAMHYRIHSLKTGRNILEHTTFFRAA